MVLHIIAIDSSGVYGREVGKRVTRMPHRVILVVDDEGDHTQAVR